MGEIELIMRLVLERLINLDKWGGAHSEWNRVKKSLPSHLKTTKKGIRNIEKARKNLINMRFMFFSKKTGEAHVSLNSKMNKEIFEFIETVERKEYKGEVLFKKV